MATWFFSYKSIYKEAQPQNSIYKEAQKQNSICKEAPLENSKVEFKGSVIISIRLLVKASSLHFLKGIDKFSF